MKPIPGLLIHTTAEFSPCRRYRYSLTRKWCSGKRCLFVLLNPSTADEFANDPTVERCQTRAAADGFGSIEVVNLFALRSTNPDALYHACNPVGDGNDHHIGAAAARAERIICGWGNHGQYRQRDADVLCLLRSINPRIYALGFTKSGCPQHPLYLPYSRVAVPF